MAVPTMYDPQRCGFGKVAWISFVSSERTAASVEDFGELYMTEGEGDDLYHAILIDPRYDPNSIYDYLEESGATLVDLSTPSYPD